MEEVEYNFGRAFHSIGVPHFAVKHYEKVLDNVQKRMDESMFPEVSLFFISPSISVAW